VGIAWSRSGEFKENSNASINFIEKINYSKKRPHFLNYIKTKIDEDSQKLYEEEVVRG